jgi:FkbM family methyltransferase
MGLLTSWLMREEPIRVIPILDRIIVIFLRIIYIGFYLVLRATLRLAVGKTKRDKLFAKKGLRFNYGFDIFLVFLLFNLIYFVTKHLGFRDHSLLKITVPKYHYKAYCPANKNDLMNLITREDEIIEKFCSREGDIVVDVGAHYGRYTLIASKCVGPNGKVVAIEAHPNNFELLNRNIKLNELKNIRSLNYAAYSKEEKIKLYLPNEQQLGQSIYNTVMSNRAETQENFVEVKANTLDYLLQSNGIKQEEVNWIKIDVEGAEYEVLKGAKDILSKSKDISLLIEIHNLSGGTNLYKPIIEYLNLYHFKIDFEKMHENGERHIIARKH